MAEEFVVYRLDIDNKRSVKSMKDLIDFQKELKKRLLDATKTGTKEYKELENAVKKNNQTITAFNRNLRSSGTLAQGVTKGMINAFKRVGVFVAAAFSINAIVNFGRAIDTLTLDMEKGFARVNTVAQVTQEELDGIRERALALGKDSASALEEIPDALFDILSGTGDLDLSYQLLESSLKATDAGFGTLSETAKAGIDIYNAVKNEVESTEEVFDVLFQTQKQGVTDITQLAAALPSVIPAAQALGLNFTETAAALATLTKAGINTAESGTALSRFFGTVAKQGKTVEKVLGKGSVFDEATGNILPLVDIVKNLSESFEGLSDEARSDILQKTGLTNISSRKAIVSLVNNLETFEKLDIDIAVNSVGELNRQLEFSDNTTRKLTKAQNELKLKLLEVGEDAAPSVTEAKLFMIESFIKVIDAGQGLIGFFRENDGAMKALLATVGVLTALLAGRMVPVIINSAKSLIGWLLNLKAVTAAQNVAAASTTRMSIAMRGFTAAVAANPIGIIVTGVVTLLTLLPLFVSGVNDSAQATENLVDHSKEFTANLAKEEGAMAALFEELKSDTTSRERRSEVMEEINTKYGKYLPFLITEETSLKDIEKAQRAANDELFRSIALKTQQEEIGSIITQRLEREKDALLALGQTTGNTQSDLLDAIRLAEDVGASLADLGIASTITEIFGGLETGGQEFSDEFKAIFESLDEDQLALIDRVKDIAVNIKTVGLTQDDFNKLVVGGTSSTLEILDVLIGKRNEEGEAIRRLTEFYRGLKGSITDANDEANSGGDQSVEAAQKASLELQKIRAEEQLIIAKTIDEEIAAREKLFNIKQQILDREIKAVKGNSDIENQNRQKLLNTKLQQEKSHVNDIISLKLEQNLVRSKLEFDGIQEELKVFRAEFRKKKQELIKAGATEEQIAEERKKGEFKIIQKFSIDRLQHEKDIELQSLKIAQSEDKNRIANKEKSKKEELQIELEFAEKKLQILQALGQADEQQIQKLQQQISLLRGQLGSSEDAISKEIFDKRLAEAQFYINSVGNSFSQLDSILSGFADIQAERINLRIESVQENIGLLQDRLQEIDQEQEGSTLLQVKRNEREKRAVRAKILSEKAELKRLAAEKEKQEKEEAKRKKTFGIINAIINTALGVTNAIATAPNIIVGLVLAAVAAALGGAQIALISGQQVAKGGLLDPDKFESGGAVRFPSKTGGMIAGPRHKDGGVPFTLGKGRNQKQAEAEGGEFITSIPATNMFLPVFEYLNNFANKMRTSPNFKYGGTVPKITRYESGGSVLSGIKGADSAELLAELRAIKEGVNQNRKTIFSMAEFREKEIEFSELEENATE